jgi:hypothetical protein
MPSNKDRRVLNLKSPDSKATLRALATLTNSPGYPYLKKLAEEIADEHAGGLPLNAEDRERLYEAAIIQKGFRALFKILDPMRSVTHESTNPSDLLSKIEHTPPELKKE